jgi:hypothetical protein
MSSATTNRPAAAMAGAVCVNSSNSCSAHLADSFSQGRSTRFPEFGAASGRHNSDSSQSSTLGQTFGTGGSWQASTGIWGPNTIGSGFPNVKRDASRSRRRSRLTRGLHAQTGRGILPTRRLLRCSRTVEALLLLIHETVSLRPHHKLFWRFKTSISSHDRV